MAARIVPITRLDNGGWHVLCASSGCDAQGPAAQDPDEARSKACAEGWKPNMDLGTQTFVCPKHEAETSPPPANDDSEDDVMF